MSDKKKEEIEKAIEIEKNIAAEFYENDDIVEYIEGKNLSDLKARYTAAEEDENIRSEGFELAQKSGVFKRIRPSGYNYGYGPQAINPRDEIKSATVSPLSHFFDSAQSEYDNDNVSFKEINIDDIKPNESNAAIVKETEVKISQTPPEVVEPPKRKRGRPRKIKPEEIKEEVIEKIPEPEKPINSMSKTYNTNTKVVFFDESTDDGIKRCTDEEVSSVFRHDSTNSEKKKKN